MREIINKTVISSTPCLLITDLSVSNAKTEISMIKKKLYHITLFVTDHFFAKHFYQSGLKDLKNRYTVHFIY